MKRLICILISVLIIAAVAAAVFAPGIIQRRESGTMDLEAEPSSEAPQSDGSGEAQDSLLEAIFDRVSSDEYVLVETGEGGAFERGIYRSFDTAAALRNALEEDSSPLRLFDAPDGYELISAKVLYDCAAGYDYEPVAGETDDSGLTVKRYTIPEEGRFISCYELEYAVPDGKCLLIDGNLTSYMDTYAAENETVERVSVDGMDEVLLFRSVDGSAARLEMSQSLTEPIAYVSPLSLAELPPGMRDSPVFEEMKNVMIDHACYSIRAVGMDGDALLALVG